nr:membrane protein insertase YidC [Planctomycetota bacterium]
TETFGKRELDQPLAVLDDFRHSAGRLDNLHNLVTLLNLAAPNLDGTGNLAWSVVAPTAPDAVTLRLELPERRLALELHYRMDADRPSVRSLLVVRNLGDQSVTLGPSIYPINGIHQDYPPTESYYLCAFAHDGGKDGSLTRVDPPDAKKSALANELLPAGRAPVAGIPLPVDATTDYIGVKARFFAALWEPLRYTAGTAPTTGGDVLATLPADAKPQWRAFITAFTGPQLCLQVAYPPAVVQPGADLQIEWRLTVTDMKKESLALLTEAERRVEYTDGMYRFFKVLAKLLLWLLTAIKVVVRDYGIAVIVLTFLVKAALHRTTFKQQASMLKMQKIQPELKLVQEQYKNDRQQLAAKQMELFKKHGVNPLGGCLPVFIQLPIFMALYQAFNHSADMRGERFLWVNDLTLPDTLVGFGFSWPSWMFIPGWGGMPAALNPLPLVYIAVTVWMSFSMKAPPTSDPQQEQMQKMMRWMPVLFGVFFYYMPAGLVLYFTVSAILSTIELKYVKKKLGMH